MDVTTYPCLNQSLTMLANGAPGQLNQCINGKQHKHDKNIFQHILNGICLSNWIYICPMSVLIIFPGPADNKMTTQQTFNQEQRGQNSWEIYELLLFYTMAGSVGKLFRVQVVKKKI